MDWLAIIEASGPGAIATEEVAPAAKAASNKPGAVPLAKPDVADLGIRSVGTDSFLRVKFRAFVGGFHDQRLVLTVGNKRARFGRAGERVHLLVIHLEIPL